MNHFLIFCTDKENETDDSGELGRWAMNNLESQTVLTLSEELVYHYQDIGLWDLISKITGYTLLGPYEEDYIYDIEILKEIYEKLSNSPFSQDTYVKKIIFIFEYAINNKVSPVVLFI